MDGRRVTARLRARGLGLLAIATSIACHREPSSDPRRAPLEGSAIVSPTAAGPLRVAGPRGGGWDLSRGYARFVPDAGLIVTLSDGAPEGCNTPPDGKPFLSFELPPGPGDGFFVGVPVETKKRLEIGSAEDTTSPWRVRKIVTVVSPFALELGQKVRGVVRIEGHLRDSEAPLVSEGSFEATICAAEDAPSRARAEAPNVDEVRGDLAIGEQKAKRALVHRGPGWYELVLPKERIGCEDLQDYEGDRTMVVFDSFPVEGTARLMPATGAIVHGRNFSMPARHAGWLKIDRPDDPRAAVHVRVGLRLEKGTSTQEVRGEITARLCP